MIQTINTTQRRLLAEWEQHAAVLLAWPHADTDWAYMLDEVAECYVSIIEAITESNRVILIAPETEIPRNRLRHIDPRKLIIIKALTNDTWTRDYGPITVEVDGKPRVCDFQFNGWGLKFAACYDNRVTAHLCETGIISAPRENKLDFVLEGGSIETDGNGTLLTTSKCLLAPNRNNTLSRHEIEQRLIQDFGLNHILWLDSGALAGDDTDSHIDTLARLAPNDTIIYTGCQDVNDEHYSELQSMAGEIQKFLTPSGQKYNLIELPLPDPILDEDGQRLPATYANYLINNSSIIMPVYNQPQKDLLASQMLKIAFPEHKILTVNCLPLIKQHGSLHCATMQLYHDTISL